MPAPGARVLIVTAHILNGMPFVAAEQKASRSKERVAADKKSNASCASKYRTKALRLLKKASRSAGQVAADKTIAGECWRARILCRELLRVFCADCYCAAGYRDTYTATRQKIELEESRVYSPLQVTRAVRTTQLRPIAEQYFEQFVLPALVQELIIYILVPCSMSVYRIYPSLYDVYCVSYREGYVLCIV